jgi:hypothetical protein
LANKIGALAQKGCFCPARASTRNGDDGSGGHHGFSAVNQRSRFCQLTDELIPLSSKKMTNSRMTTVTIASTCSAISYFSMSYVLNSQVISQLDSDSAVEFRSYDVPKPIDLTNGREIFFGN